jgi:hypothetical protein
MKTVARGWESKSIEAQQAEATDKSLALIGNASERSLRVEEEADPRRFR